MLIFYVGAAMANMIKLIWVVMKLSWVPLAFIGLGVLFFQNSVANWLVGKQWGSPAVLMPADTISFIPFDFTSGQLWGATFVTLGFFQFLVFGWLWQSMKRRDIPASFFQGVACVSLTALSFTTGLIYQAGNVDLTEKTSAATSSSFKNINVQLAGMYKKTQVIAPRSAPSIQAEIDQLLNKRIRVGGKYHVLKSYSRSCSAARRGTRAGCDSYFKLKRELAASIDYIANKSDIETAEGVQSGLLVVDLNAGFLFIRDLLGVDPKTFKKYKTLGGQCIVEFFILMGVTLIRWGIKGASISLAIKANKYPDFNDPIGTSIDASMGAFVHDEHIVTRSPSQPFTVIEGGKARPSKFAVCDDSSLIAFVGSIKNQDTGFLRVYEFMDQYRAFCMKRGFKALGQNVVGTLLERCGGEKGRITQYTAKGKQTYRKTWRLSQSGLQMVRAA